MSSTGISSGYLYRCADRAESFSDTLLRPGRTEVRQGSAVLGLQNALTYKETRTASSSFVVLFWSTRYLSESQNRLLFDNVQACKNRQGSPVTLLECEL